MVKKIFNSVISCRKSKRYAGRKVSAFIRNKMQLDAVAVEIVFPNRPDTENVNIGDEAEINNDPANGEYVMPDGRTFVFVNGYLIDILKDVDAYAAKRVRPQLFSVYKGKQSNLKIANVRKKSRSNGATIPPATKTAVAVKKTASKKEIDRTVGLRAYLNKRTCTNPDRAAGARAWLESRTPAAKQAIALKKMKSK